MMITPILHQTFRIVPLLCLLGACSQEQMATPDNSRIDAAAQTVPAVVTDCADEPGISYLCGPRNAEDILRIGSGPWLLTSGMNGELTGNTEIQGKLQLVNHETHAWEVLFPGTEPMFTHNIALFEGCPGPLDVNNFSAHGLAIQALADQPDHYRVYLTSHGAREAIEVFELDASGSKPSIAWSGCVLMPESAWTNSLVVLDDGGFLATQFMETTGPGMAAVRAGEITGHVFEWHPGGEVTVVPGTELSGANGIALTDDERWLFVAAYGTHEIVRFDRSVSPPSKTVIPLGITADNVRWNDSGDLLISGLNVEGCTDEPCGWSVVALDPEALTVSPVVRMDGSITMQGVATALQVGDELWLGTYSGDRLGIVPLP